MTRFDITLIINSYKDITKGELSEYLILHQDLIEHLDEKIYGDTTPAPGPLGQIFGNTGQFLQNFIQGWATEMWLQWLQNDKKVLI